MNTDIWKTDKHIEEAMLQSSLLFLKSGIQAKTSRLFQKSVLSLILGGKADTVDSIFDYYSRKNIIADKAKVRSAVDKLKKDKFVDELEDGHIVIKDNKDKELKDSVNEIDAKLKQLVSDIYTRIKEGYKKQIPCEQQIISNIKACLNYYFKVCALSYFDINERKNVADLDPLKDLAGQGISKDKKELTEHLLYVIGCVIDSPTDEHYSVLELLARLHLSAQMMNLDPLMANFKATQIRGKIFILDTEVLLHAITDNASHSHEYRMMIKQLLSNGCQLYVPSKIINEVYNHGEASLKRYSFVSHQIDIDDKDAPSKFGNVFIEDYHYLRLKKLGTCPPWNRFINNYFNEDYGTDYTVDVIRDALGDKIFYNQMPEHPKLLQSDYDALYNRALEETIKTSKAQHREYERNEEIADTDTDIYLSVKSINKRENAEGTRNKRGELMNECYFLTNSYRIHACAKELNIDADVICNPRILIAYLSEAGYIGIDDVKFTKLFDNPFLIYTAQVVEQDVLALAKAKVDLSGMKIVAMRYELKQEIQRLLSDVNDVDEFTDIYHQIRSKGYAYEAQIEQVMTERASDKEKITRLEETIAELTQMNIEKDEQLESKDRRIGKLEYMNRVGQKIK